MKLRSIKWGEHTWEEVKQIATEGAVAVVPFGSTEQHGPMLPLDTDIHIADRWAADGATVAYEKYGVPALVVPTMPFGLAAHHMKFAGTITLEPETYIAVVAQILGCVVEHGFRRIALVKGHGGNRAGMELGVVKVLRQASRPLRIALFQDHRDPEFARWSEEIYGQEPPQGQSAFHADRWETSETLADRPHLVRVERMVRPPLLAKSMPEWTIKMHEVTPTGATGDPSMARADLGEKTWHYMAEAVGLFIKRLWETELPDEY